MLALTGTVRLDPVAINRGASGVILAFAFLYFIYLGFFAGLDAAERKRVVVMFLLFLACAMFWAGFEQAGASLNLFADRYTDRLMFGWDMPAGVLQGVNSTFIIIFAPVFAALWVWLGQRNLDPSAPAKFGIGLILMGIGFFVMYLASQYVVAGEKVLPTWLVLTYMFHTFGELCLSPVGLSSFTKLAPARFVGQSLGLVVHGHGSRQQHRGTDLRRVRSEQSAGDARAVHVHLLVGRAGRARHAAADALDEETDGRRQIGRGQAPASCPSVLRGSAARASPARLRSAIFRPWLRNGSSA